MRRVWGAVCAAIVAALILAGAGSAVGTKTIPFTAKYAGHATVTNSDNVATISATGVGTGTPIGKGTIAGNGKGDSSQQPCVPFAGTGKMVGKLGVLNFKVNVGSSACGDEGGHSFSVSGKAAVLKGSTGAVRGAKGTLKFTGFYNHDDGSFNVKFTGVLTR